MAKIDIEYRHTDAPVDNPAVRRTVPQMVLYIRDLICEMQMADISCRFIDTKIPEGPNTVLINGRTIPEIIEGLKIKYLDATDSCDMGNSGVVGFGRPVLDWDRNYVEDVPDTIMKNAIAKVFADCNKNDLPMVE